MTGRSADTSPAASALASSANLQRLGAHPNGAHDVLRGYTVSAHDAASAWPHRCLKRRLACKNLFDRSVRRPNFPPDQLIAR